MDPTAFKPERPGRLVQTGPVGARYWAYIPKSLPPELSWSGQLVSQLSAADRALGRLAGSGQMLPNPHLLIGPFKRREAVLSSRIEGTQASLSDLVLFEVQHTSAAPGSDVLEVANYVAALDYGLARRATLPLSKRLIAEMHGILMQGVRGQERTPGEFRSAQNWIGPPGCTLNEATFVPPPPEHLHDCLDQLERYLHEPSELPPIIRLALIHYQFEAIHPFVDGNGRIGRLLVTLMLCMEGVLPGPLLYLSAFFERHRAEYYRRLLAVSQAGEWDDWISFFLRGVTEQAVDAVERADRLVALRGRYHAMFHHARSSALLLKLIDALFDLPALTVARARTILGVTSRAAQLNIDKLTTAGVLREVTGQTRNRIWVADAIREITE